MESHFLRHIYFDTLAHCFVYTTDLQTYFIAAQNAPENRISRISAAYVRTPLALPIKIAFVHLVVSLSSVAIEIHWHSVEICSVHDFKRLNFHTNTSGAWDLHIVLRFNAHHILSAIIDLIEYPLFLALYLFIRCLCISAPSMAVCGAVYFRYFI